jgi:hypothetical protein
VERCELEPGDVATPAGGPEVGAPAERLEELPHADMVRQANPARTSAAAGWQ